MGRKSGVRERLDVLMVSRGLAESREQAKRFILAGVVGVKGIENPKPGLLVDPAAEIRLKAKERYVSRGGLKLEAALKMFQIDLADLVCADIGASTGGFTDCMLQHGARQVYAVDVGATQMHEKIRTNNRIILLEHTNARSLTPQLFDTAPDFAAVDVSFISILRITVPLREVLKSTASAVLLIKPQFEAGREAVSRGRGVIKDEAVHREVLLKVLQELVSQGWNIESVIPSPVIGGSGNREFLCYATIASSTGRTYINPHIDIDEVIRSAGATFK